MPHLAVHNDQDLLRYWFELQQQVRPAMLILQRWPQPLSLLRRARPCMSNRRRREESGLLSKMHCSDRPWSCTKERTGRCVRQHTHTLITIVLVFEIRAHLVCGDSVSACHPQKIAEVAFGNTKSDVQCLHRWQKVLDPKLVKGPVEVGGG